MPMFILLFSAGMDGTARMWNLENLDLDATTIIERNQLLREHL